MNMRKSSYLLALLAIFSLLITVQPGRANRSTGHGGSCSNRGSCSHGGSCSNRGSRDGRRLHPGPAQ